MYPSRSSSAGVAPTTTQSRSRTSRPRSRSRTAPPTKYTCIHTCYPTFALRPCSAHALRLQGCYVTQAARGQMKILNAREPISEVLEDPAAPADLKQRLETVRAAREFASRELGLPNNKSYTSYADLKREYVVWNVVATPEFSVEPREWCFPIVGCVRVPGLLQRAQGRRIRRGAAHRGVRGHRRRRAPPIRRWANSTIRS